MSVQPRTSGALATLPRALLLLVVLVSLALGLLGFGGGGIASAHTPGCRISQLRVSLGPELSPPTGQNPLAARLTNRGSKTCLLRGYPAVALVNETGRVLPFAIRKSGDQVVTSRPPVDVRVQAGRSAWIVLNKYRCDRGDVQLARAVRIGLPGAPRTDRLILAIPQGWNIGYCGKGDPGSTLHVSPVEPNLRAALAR